MKLFSFVQAKTISMYSCLYLLAKTLCRYGCMYFLVVLVLVCVEVMVISSA